MFIIWGIISILFGFGILILLTSGVLDLPREALKVMIPFGIILSMICIGTGILEIVGGRGLINHRRWSRMLVIVMAAINISSSPIGFALGIYAFWVLFKTESEQVLIA